ncbi:MAG: hypothetical protein IPQ25_19220 [Chitinophagaceae bacterium]|nr:hypothetical protein [Chitinophagaceae bacterium]
MYFVIALINAVLTNRLRRIEKQVREKEEKEKTVKLYNTLLNSLSHELKTPISYRRCHRQSPGRFIQIIGRK